MALQRWNKQQAAVIAGGLSTYTFPVIGEGFACVCSVSVPGAATGTQWFVYVDGALVTSMYGAASASGIYLAGGDQLTISGVSPIFAGIAVASGVLGLSGEVPPSSPISGGTPQALLGVGTIGAGFTTVVVTPSAWAVGLIVANAVGPITAQANYATPTIPNSLVNLPTLLVEDINGNLVWFIPLAGIGGQVLITIPAQLITAYVAETTAALTETTSVPAYTISVSNPAPGADWTYTLPAPARLVAVTATLDTGAGVTSRVPVLAVQPPSVATGAYPLNTGLAVGAVNLTCAWFPGGPAPYAPVNAAPYYFSTAGIPNFLLPAATVVKTATQGLGAADQWTNINLTLAPI